MRCLALGQVLRDAGADVSFVSRELPGHLCEFTDSLGFRVIRLPARGFARSSGEPDFSEIRGPATGAQIDWLVIDHYGIDAAWERRASAHCRHILVIDDLADRPHECDVLLDQNFSLHPRARYDGLLNPSCELLLGPRYALLRPEFAATRAAAQQRDGTVRRIFVFFGGSDAGGETLKVIDALAALPRQGLLVNVVIGRSNPHAAEILDACARLAGAVCQVGSNSMAAMMSDADLAIGAGGSTTWERCCVGLPSIIIAIADNQIPGSRDLHEAGCVLLLGKSAEVSVRAITETVLELLANPARMRALSFASAALVDGHGAQRVTNSMLAADMTLRRARHEDCIDILNWRNHPEIRRFSSDTGEIAPEAHLMWFARKLADPSCEFLIGELNGNPVGVIRYDVRGHEAVVSIYLVPGRQGRGLGKALLRKGRAWLSGARPEIRRVSAEILKENLRSALAFEASGFRSDGGRYYQSL